MIITVCNFKGGVGKTTTCHAISTAKGMQGSKVLVIDLDAQHSLTTSCGINVNEFNNRTVTISELIIADINNIDYDINDVQESIISLEHIDIIPSTSRLNQCDRLLTKTDNILALKNVISKLNNLYDYIFIDCSPSRNLLCENALLSSDSVLIPVESYYLGSEGLYEFIELLSNINDKFENNIRIEGIILTMFQNTKVCKSIKEYLFKGIKRKNKELLDLKDKNIKIYKETIPRSIKVSEAGIYGKSIVEYLPNNIVAQQYIKIASQIN